MSKKKALSIKAVVTPNITAYFYLESFIGYIAFNKDSNLSVLRTDIVSSDNTLEGITKIRFYTGGSYTTTPTKILDTIKSSLTDRADCMPSKIWYRTSASPDDTEMYSIHSKICEYVNGINSTLGANLREQVTDNIGTATAPAQRVIAAHIRYLISKMNDEDYNSLIADWKTCIISTIKKDFPELDGEISLVFSNDAIIEE